MKAYIKNKKEKKEKEKKKYIYKKSFLLVPNYMKNT